MEPAANGVYVFVSQFQVAAGEIGRDYSEDTEKTVVPILEKFDGRRDHR